MQRCLFLTGSMAAPRMLLSTRGSRAFLVASVFVGVHGGSSHSFRSQLLETKTRDLVEDVPAVVVSGMGPAAVDKHGNVRGLQWYPEIQTHARAKDDADASNPAAVVSTAWNTSDQHPAVFVAMHVLTLIVPGGPGVGWRYWCCKVAPLLVLVVGSIAHFGVNRVQAREGSLAEVVVSVVLFMMTTPLIIFINSGLMNYQGFPFPMTVATMGVLGTFLFAQAMVWTGRWKLEVEMNRQTFWKAVFPVALLGICSFYFGNAAYLYLPVSVIQVLKSVTLAFTFVGGSITGLERFTWGTLFAVLLVIFGSVLASLKEGVPGVSAAVPLLGLAVVLLADVSEAARVLFMQLSTTKLPVTDAIYWCTLTLLVMQIVVILAMEASALRPSHFTLPILRGLTFSACAGCGCNVASWWISARLGGVYLNVLGNVRNYIVVVIAAQLRSEYFSERQAIGYSVALAGAFIFESFRGQPKSIAKESC